MLYALLEEGYVNQNSPFDAISEEKWHDIHAGHYNRNGYYWNMQRGFRRINTEADLKRCLWFKKHRSVMPGVGSSSSIESHAGEHNEADDQEVA